MSAAFVSVACLVASDPFAGALAASRPSGHPFVGASPLASRPARLPSLSAEQATPVPDPAPAVMNAAYAYDMFTAEGGVMNFGGAGWYGNEKWRHLLAPIVGMAMTPDGRGYWLAGANGSVFRLGDARWYGSLAHSQLGPGQAIVAIDATADGKGYWLINQSGAIISFGDAPQINGERPLPDLDLPTPVIGGAIRPGGHGGWLTDAGGHVYNVGLAPFYGSLAGQTLAHPITAIAEIPSGLGYWLTDSAGDVWHFGSAASGGRGPTSLSGKVVGIAPAQSRYGYWTVTNTGEVLSGGYALSRGQPSPAATESSVVGIVAAPQIYAPIPVDSVGYDINWPQCSAPGSSSAGPLPGPPGYPSGTSSYTLAIVGVDGWATGPYNSCLKAETAWARQAVYPAGAGLSGRPPYDLYMFLNSPPQSSTIDKSGPAGTCADLASSERDACLTYNYGYNAALAAVSYASSAQAHARIWWLDIENDICAPGVWNDAAAGEWWSCDQSLNAVTIQGAIDALHSLDITAGVYSTSVQWLGITDDYVPRYGTIPIWIAGANYTSPPYPLDYGYPAPTADSMFCTESGYRFAGGKPLMLQETPGNGYSYDPDLAC